ncbi:energy transducer TonB [Pontibacter populi]|uniref:TonB family protein n=1 Tax=Pontibacter populi TaxID=890055 RepID=A0ABV1RPJ9_9BACT
MRKILLLLLSIVLGVTLNTQAQQYLPNLIRPDSTVFVDVDVYPILVTSEGNYGIKKLKKFIGKHLMWPDPQMDCSGTVVISFIVEVDGSVSDSKYLKRLCPKFDEEAMRVASMMNRWQPGIVEGKKVRTRMSIPITFRID